MRPGQPIWGWSSYAISVAILIASLAIATRLYPSETFDWQYTVVSALASKKHNPEGCVWFSAGLGIAMLALWPFLNVFWKRGETMGRMEGLSVFALKSGIACGALMAVESVLSPKLPLAFEKTHELLALLAFLFSYLGIVGLAVSKVRRQTAFLGPIALLIAPLLAIGVSQFALYLSQRNLGWVDQSWRELGVPVWQSFAFWQWLALGVLWIGLATLAAMGARRH